MQLSGGCCIGALYRQAGMPIENCIGSLLDKRTSVLETKLHHIMAVGPT